ncbi:hypothetical protein BDR04DRAFT_1163625 [Suillus decipiens]|nr:hypothetical protein BDR04DRAFT_1163625 [Suillus decipiens]
MPPKKKTTSKALPEWAANRQFIKKQKPSTANSSLATTTDSSPLDTPEITERILEGTNSDLEDYEVQQQLLTESEREDPGRDDPDKSDSLPDAPISETIIWPVEEIPSPPSNTKDKLITPPRPHVPTCKPLAPTPPFSTLST